MKRYTEENITTLNENEVFVFGSNEAGNHAGGAAKMALEKFGAVMGQGEGLQGRSYAIPTLDGEMRKVSEDKLLASLRTFADYAMENQGTTFLLTKIGCGIAGFSVEEMTEMIARVSLPENVVIPEEFAFFKRAVFGYKGFGHDLKCRGKQYAIGETAEEERADLCNEGIHFCENPHEVFSYYSPGDGNRFCQVEAYDVSTQCENDTKRVAKRLSLKAEISVFDICKIAVYAFFENFGFRRKINSVVGDRGAANAGNRGAANAGHYGAANAGNRGAANAGYRGAANAGDYGAANAGNRGAANAGNRGAANAGDYGAANAGYRGAANAGDYGAANAGDYGAANAGDYGAAIVSNGGKVKGGLGCILVARNMEYNIDKNRFEVIGWAAAIVDNVTIMEDTWYELRDGKLVKCDDKDNA